MILYILALYIVLSVVLISKQRWSSNKTFIWGCFCLFIGVTTLRTHNMPDYENYYDYFVTGDFDRAEIGFKFYVESLKHIVTNPKILFLAVALLSVGIKWTAIQKLSPCIWGTLLIYLSHFFILHDMIQIRAAIASGLFLWATKYLAERDAKRFFLISAIAVLFHNSAFVIFPLWFINTSKTQKKLYLWMIPIAYIIVITGHSFGYLVSHIPITQIQTLWMMYEQMMAQDVGTAINIFNSMHLLRCAVCIFILINIDKIAQYSPYAITWAKLYTISFVAFLLLSDIPVVAFRISELLQIVEILLIPTILLLPRYRQLGKYMIIGFAGFCVFLNIFYNQYVI